MAVTSWRTAGTVINSDRGPTLPAWTFVLSGDPGQNSFEYRLAFSDNAYVFTSFSTTAAAASDWLRCTNFGFSAEIPTGATINGIEVRGEAQSTSANGQVEVVMLRIAPGQVG